MSLAASDTPLPSGQFFALPPELWTHVFHFVNEDPVTMDHERTTIPLLYVTHVCHAWRQICVANSTFWSHIRLVMCIERCRRFKRAKEALDMVMERSCSSPLKITLDTELEEWSNWISLPPRSQDEWSLRRLLLESNRWRTVNMHPCIISLFNRDEGNLAQLRRVSFCDTYQEQEEFPLYPEWFQSAPLLQDLTLSTTDVIKYTFPWSQIKKVKLRDPSYIDVLGLSASCPDVEELYLLDHSHPGEDPCYPEHYDVPHTIPFPHLRTLTVSSIYVDDWDSEEHSLTIILSDLTRIASPLRALDFEISYFGDACTWIQEKFVAMLESFPKLEEVSLRNLPMTDQQMLAVLEKLSNVRRLLVQEETSFKDHFVSSRFVRSLLLGQASRPGDTLLPELECVEVHAETVSMDCVLTSLEARARSPVQALRRVLLHLNTLEVTHCRDSVERLEGLRRKGLDILVEVDGKWTYEEWFRTHAASCLSIRWSQNAL